MKLAKIFTFGLAAMTAAALATPNAVARNQGKYTNVPFAVPGYCTTYGPDPGVNAGFVTLGGKLQIKVVANGEADSGFEVYCSNPSTGTLPANADGTFPQGFLHFNITGVPANGNVFYSVHFSDGSYLGNGFIYTPVVNNAVTINAQSTAGLTVTVIKVWVSTNGNTAPVVGPPYATAYVSNVYYNNVAILSDTTSLDTSSTDPNFCDFN